MNKHYLDNLCHDLYTPLYSFMSVCDHLIEANNADEMKALAKTLSDASKALFTYQHRLMQMIDAIQIKPTQSHYFSFKKMLDDVITLLKPFAAIKKIQIICHNDIDEIYMDSNRLYRIMVELLNNAIKYSQHNEIVIETHAQEKNIHITVTNTTHTPSADYFSSDQGLSIVKQFINDLNGDFKFTKGAYRNARASKRALNTTTHITIPQQPTHTRSPHVV